MRPSARAHRRRARGHLPRHVPAAHGGGPGVRLSRAPSACWAGRVRGPRARLRPGPPLAELHVEPPRRPPARVRRPGTRAAAARLRPRPRPARAGDEPGLRRRGDPALDAGGDRGRPRRRVGRRPAPSHRRLPSPGRAPSRERVRRCGPRRRPRGRRNGGRRPGRHSGLPARYASTASTSALRPTRCSSRWPPGHRSARRSPVCSRGAARPSIAAEDLFRWFREWVTAGIFRSVTVEGPASRGDGGPGRTRTFD